MGYNHGYLSYGCLRTIGFDVPAKEPACKRMLFGDTSVSSVVAAWVCMDFTELTCRRPRAMMPRPVASSTS